MSLRLPSCIYLGFFPVGLPEVPPHYQSPRRTSQAQVACQLVVWDSCCLVNPQCVVPASIPLWVHVQSPCSPSHPLLSSRTRFPRFFAPEAGLSPFLVRNLRYKDLESRGTLFDSGLGKPVWPGWKRVGRPVSWSTPYRLRGFGCVDCGELQARVNMPHPAKRSIFVVCSSSFASEWRADLYLPYRPRRGHRYLFTTYLVGEAGFLLWIF